MDSWPTNIWSSPSLRPFSSQGDIRPITPFTAEETRLVLDLSRRWKGVAGWPAKWTPSPSISLQDLVFS
jgi:hypothetical protein